MAIQVMFVDDEPNILSGLRRMLHDTRGELEMTFASSGREALEILARKPHDIVVSDMRMPEMDGAELLDEVQRQSPETIRIILSGHSEQEPIMRSIGSTHQYLTKPCDPAVLLTTIRRAVALRSLLADDRIRGLTARLRTLPSLPPLYDEVVRELQSPGCSIAKVGEIISQDAGMTAQILKVVNSAFFGLRREITNAADAVKYLGLSTVTALVISSHVFEQADEETRDWADFDGIYTHGLRTASTAKIIASMESDDRRLIEDVFAAAVLHDAGKIVLSMNEPTTYRRILEEVSAGTCSLHEAERDRLGASHAEVGAYLIGIWGLPNTMIETLAYHHTPSACPHDRFSSLTAVHVACAFDRHRGAACPGPKDAAPDQDYLKRLKLESRLDTWWDACQVEAI